MDTLPWPEYDATPIARAPKASDERQESLDLALWPAEILTNVLVYLEWKDLLRIRRVSKRLSEASRIRAVWLNCIYNYNLQCILRKRVDLYTSAELEDTFLSAQKAKVVFTYPASHLSTTSVDYGVSKRWCRILTGGRWLIAEPTWSDRHSGVLYFDLEDPKNPTWHRLIDIPSS